MDIKNKKVLILGGWGLVGSATARRILKEQPSQIILTSLLKSEAEDICGTLSKEFKTKPGFFKPWWGNIFLRAEWKDIPREELINDAEKRSVLIDDIVNELNDDMLHSSAVYKLLEETKPDIIIDCINTATAIAYQNIYKSYNSVLHASRSGSKDFDSLKEQTEKMILASYVPQLIRHVQLLYNAMTEFKTSFYLKVGTSGTGGMGLNIPFTHSEEKPSRVLLSKSSVAGAHTLLLFLMARTPEGPFVKELKPTASIAWKRITYDEVMRRGKPIDIYDTSINDAADASKFFSYSEKPKVTGTLKTAFIDTGENGIFSRGEFETITTLGQMEFVTPEEIAEDAVREIKGGNTGHDVIGALDQSVMEPSYRAGFLQHTAAEKLASLEEENSTHSVAFEMLGPPRLSKLLFEAHLIRLKYKSFSNYINKSAADVCDELTKLLSENDALRNEIVSIGIPILYDDGRILRGPDVKIPSGFNGSPPEASPENIYKWASEGWLDLRKENWQKWIERFKAIMKDTESKCDRSFSSKEVFTSAYWDDFKSINIGKIVGWLFINEEKGLRIKG